MPPPELDILRPGARPYRDTGIPKCLFSITLPRPVPSTTEQAPFFQLHPFEFHSPAMTAGHFNKNISAIPWVPEVRNTPPYDHANAYPAGSYGPASRPHLDHTIFVLPSLSFDERFDLSLPVLLCFIYHMCRAAKNYTAFQNMISSPPATSYGVSNLSR